MNARISIIVPVFKAEKTLERCVRSVLSQDFSDIELILVEDGSPDDSGRLCDALADTDSRIFVFHKPNGGSNSARKFGVEKARGNWVMFLDSDDELLPGSIATLYACASEYADADVVEGGHSRRRFAKKKMRKAELFLRRNSLCRFSSGIGEM